MAALSLSGLRTIGASMAAPRCRCLHTTRCLLADTNSTQPSTQDSSPPQTNTAARPPQKRSELAVRQLQRLGRRPIQGIVGVTQGGFKPNPKARSSRPQSVQQTPERSGATASTPSRQPPSSNLQIRRTMSPSRSFPPSQRPSDGTRGPPPFVRRAEGLAKPISAKEFQARRQSGRKGGPRDRRGKSSSDDEVLSKEEEAAVEELFWMAQSDMAEHSVDATNHAVQIGLLEAEHLAITSQSLITKRTPSLAGASGPATEIAAVIGRLAQRPDDTWANDDDLSRRLTSGQLVQFRNAAEKDRVMKLANEKSIRVATLTAIRKGKPFEKKEIGWAPVPQEQKDKLISRVLKGDYSLHDLSEDKGRRAQTIGTIETMLGLKETVTSDASKMFVNTFKQLWPAEASNPTANSTKRA